jgi:small subunit ribosomal protein S17
MAVAVKTKKEFVGVVKSDKMDKTIVVVVETTALHPLYKKYVRRIKKLKAHDETNSAKIGDRVRVVECRPISKEKCWKLAEIIERAK